MYTAGLTEMQVGVFDKPVTAAAYLELAQAGLLRLDTDDGKLKPNYGRVGDSLELLGYQEVLQQWIPVSDARTICDWMGGGKETDATDAAMATLGQKCPWLYNLVLSKANDKHGAEEQSVSRQGMQDLRRALDTVTQPAQWVVKQGISIADATRRGVEDTLGVANKLLSNLPLVLLVAGGLYALLLWKTRPVGR